MAREDYLSFGSTPADEPCAQVGDPDYYDQAKAECRRFIDLIRYIFGPEPPGAHLAIKSFPHDFGSYYEVVCYFEDSLSDSPHPLGDDTESGMSPSAEYAYNIDNNLPLTWGDTTYPVNH